MKYQLSPVDVQELTTICKNVRIDIVEMLARAGSGHPGGSLSCVELLSVLFWKILRHGPTMKDWNSRDHFHLSKGHVGPTVYSILSRFDYFSREELKKLRKMGAMLQGHPHSKSTPGIEVSSGSLGQGLSVACGMALAGRLNKADYTVYSLMGDGEIQEGQVWEAAMFAAHYKLGNLCAILDNNGLQIDGKVSDVMSVYPIADKFSAFGFHVITVDDGHDVAKVYDAFKCAQEVTDKPKIIIAKTVKGKGVSFMENNAGFHGKTTTGDETAKALKDLGV